jgi:hypothetical protein
MRTAIATIFATAALAGLAGCESSAETSSARMLRYQVDATRDRSVWLTRDGVLIHSAVEPGQAVSLPDWLWAGGPYCPPDLALGPNGEAVITSNVVSTVWKVDPATLAVTVHPLALNADNDKDVGFAAIAYSAEQGAFIAYSETQRSLWKIDPDLKTAVKIAPADFRRPRSAKARLTPCADLAQRLNLGE